MQQQLSNDFTKHVRRAIGGVSRDQDERRFERRREMILDGAFNNCHFELTQLKSQFGSTVMFGILDQAVVDDFPIKQAFGLLPSSTNRQRLTVKNEREEKEYFRRGILFYTSSTNGLELAWSKKTSFITEDAIDFVKELRERNKKKQIVLLCSNDSVYKAHLF
jgi:hypothetical protein